MERLSYEERHLIVVALRHQRDDLRKACLEDQGTPDGEPGTIGHSLQQEIERVIVKVWPTASVY